MFAFLLPKILHTILCKYMICYLLQWDTLGMRSKIHTSNHSRDNIARIFIHFRALKSIKYMKIMLGNQFIFPFSSSTTHIVCQLGWWVTFTFFCFILQYLQVKQTWVCVVFSFTHLSNWSLPYLMSKRVFLIYKKKTDGKIARASWKIKCIKINNQKSM